MRRRDVLAVERREVLAADLPRVQVERRDVPVELRLVTRSQVVELMRLLAADIPRAAAVGVRLAVVRGRLVAAGIRQGAAGTQRLPVILLRRVAATKNRRSAL